MAEVHLTKFLFEDRLWSYAEKLPANSRLLSLGKDDEIVIGDVVFCITMMNTLWPPNCIGFRVTELVNDKRTGEPLVRGRIVTAHDALPVPTVDIITRLATLRTRSEEYTLYVQTPRPVSAERSAWLHVMGRGAAAPKIHVTEEGRTKLVVFSDAEVRHMFPEPTFVVDEIGGTSAADFVAVGAPNMLAEVSRKLQRPLTSAVFRYKGKPLGVDTMDDLEVLSLAEILRLGDLSVTFEHGK